MQGALAKPADTTSRVRRIGQIDLSTLTTTKEFAYVASDGSSVTPAIAQNRIFLSDLFAVDDDTLLVGQRDSGNALKNVVEINVSGATNIVAFKGFHQPADRVQRQGVDDADPLAMRRASGDGVC